MLAEDIFQVHRFYKPVALKGLNLKTLKKK